VPKSTTLDGLEGPLRTPFQNTCVLRTHHENFNEDRPILSAREMQPVDFRFWQYKVLCGFHGGPQDICNFSLDLRIPVSIYTDMVCLLAVKISPFVDDT